jgi:hypothetical protein
LDIMTYGVNCGILDDYSRGEGKAQASDGLVWSGSSGFERVERPEYSINWQSGCPGRLGRRCRSFCAFVARRHRNAVAARSPISGSGFFSLCIEKLGKRGENRSPQSVDSDQLSVNRGR